MGLRFNSDSPVAPDLMVAQPGLRGMLGTLGEPSHAVVANDLIVIPCLPCATNTHYHQDSRLEKERTIKLINLHHPFTDLYFY